VAIDYKGNVVGVIDNGNLWGWWLSITMENFGGLVSFDYNGNFWGRGFPLQGNFFGEVLIGRKALWWCSISLFPVFVLFEPLALLKFFGFCVHN